MAFITPLPPGFKTSLLYLRVETKMEIFGLSFQVHVSIMAFIHPHLMSSTNTYPLPETTMESLACLFRCIFLFWHSFTPPPGYSFAPLPHPSTWVQHIYPLPKTTMESLTVWLVFSSASSFLYNPLFIRILVQ